jgi:hypothetical protein
MTGVAIAHVVITDAVIGGMPTTTHTSLDRVVCLLYLAAACPPAVTTDRVIDISVITHLVITYVLITNVVIADVVIVDVVITDVVISECNKCCNDLTQ